MQLRRLLAAVPASLILALAHAGPVMAGDFAPGLPAPGILGLVAAALVGVILLARRGK